MANPNPTNKFSSTRQPPVKVKNHRTILLEALKAANKPMTEIEFVTHYINEAMQAEPAQASSMLREIFLRINPIPKPVAPVIEFEFPSDGTAVDKVNAIVAGVACGNVPADIGKMMADIIKTGLDIEETTDLAQRLEKLEALLAEQLAKD